MKKFPIAVFSFVLLYGLETSSNAACILTGGLAGQNIAYRYAIAHINGLLNADDALNRMNQVSGILQRPSQDQPSHLAGFTEALTNLELAARGFECAALAVRPQEQFPLDPSDSFGKNASELARDATKSADLLYLVLAKEARAIASTFAEVLKGTLNASDLAVRMAKSSANLQDSLSSLLPTFTSTAHVIVDPKPDASDHMSRLRITAKERDDLVKMIDSWFGDRARSPSKGGLPPIDAAVTLFRNWFTTPGYTARP